MIKRKTIYGLHRKHYKGRLSRHSKLSANVLSQLTFELDKHPIPYQLDYTYPFHLKVIINGQRLSLHCGGFSKRLELATVDIKGEANVNTEVGFMTPRGAVNYILRNWGKPKKGAD